MTPSIETAASELSATELEAIKQRCEKATPGPWEVPGVGGGLSYTAVTGPEFEFTCGECGFRIYGNQVPLARVEDAWFIAESRTDIPKLLTYIERLRKLCGLVGFAMVGCGRVCGGCPCGDRRFLLSSLACPTKSNTRTQHPARKVRMNCLKIETYVASRG